MNKHQTECRDGFLCKFSIPGLDAAQLGMCIGDRLASYGIGRNIHSNFKCCTVSRSRGILRPFHLCSLIPRHTTWELPNTLFYQPLDQIATMEITFSQPSSSLPSSQSISPSHQKVIGMHFCPFIQALSLLVHCMVQLP